MILVGSTGFVGRNLIKQGSFEKVYHRTNVEEAYTSSPEIMIYAGVTGMKFWANKFPMEDMKVIECAKRNIEKINAKKLILISTVDVYDDLESDENRNNQRSQFGMYGKHRLELEQWVKKEVLDYHIVRLPAIYGDGLKKNYIYDLIHIIPPMLSEPLFKKLKAEIKEIENSYEKSYDGFYYFKSSYKNVVELREKFMHTLYNAVSFTNCNSDFQYYNLSWLWNDILFIMDKGIRCINFVTEPINSGELYRMIYGEKFQGITSGAEIKYHLKSKHADLFGGKNGYIYSKEYILNDLINYIRRELKKYSE